MYKYSFEKLDVWQNAIELSTFVYTITKVFPDEEKFVLISQMRRAAISVASNIAEGTSRRTLKDKNYFIMVAYTSLMELLNQFIIANKLNYISKEVLNESRDKIGLISNQLNKMSNYYKNK